MGVNQSSLNESRSPQSLVNARLWGLLFMLCDHFATNTYYLIITFLKVHFFHRIKAKHRQIAIKTTTAIYCNMIILL